jgi:hypothetical protein
MFLPRATLTVPRLRLRVSPAPLIVIASLAAALSSPPTRAWAQENADDTASRAANLQGQVPRMDFDRLRHAFGRLARGEKALHKFEFTNTGKGTLQVRSIHAACGCVNTRVEPTDTFAPGESGRIVFEFDSSLFVGPVVRTITVDTNSTSPATQTLTFTADVAPEIVLRPNVVTMGEIPKEYTGTFVIEADVSGRAPTGGKSMAAATVNKSTLTPSQKAQALDESSLLRVTHVATSSPTLVGSIVSSDDKKARVEVKVQGPLPIGPFRERVTLWNNSRHMKELVVAVTGEVVGHVKPSAEYLEFGVVGAPKSVRRSLTLTSDEASFRVNAVEIDMRRSEALRGVKPSEIVAFSTEKTKDGVVVHFDMRVPGNLSALGGETVGNGKVNASGVFVVRTSDPDYKEIRVPFFGVLRTQ